MEMLFISYLPYYHTAFQLSDAKSDRDEKGYMTGFDMFRMPHDAHIVSMYPIGCNNGGDYKSHLLGGAGEEYFTP